jgi:beta-galactosidase
MTAATVSVNGSVRTEHRGGYLPFSVDVTDDVAGGRTAHVAVILDSRFNVNVPPNLPQPATPSAIDYHQPGGIHRDVWLRIEPSASISSVALQNENVLSPPGRRVRAVISIDSTEVLTDGSVELAVVDGDGAVVASIRRSVDIPIGRSEQAVELAGLDSVRLWDVDEPTLYEVVATLLAGEEVRHRVRVRTGFREARFEMDGFYLNGTRRYLFGLNRHGSFPFTGFAMPDRVHRRDAAIIKNELNCVMVRCSHYPQTESFLDACDELGLLVWEESPGWQYVGDAEWQDHAVQEITDMIARDRHRPSIIVWGARPNETPDRPAFNVRTEALVKSLDPTRATSGTMFGDYAQQAMFHHDVFSYDDYSTAVGTDGSRRPTILPPRPDRPYLISEAVSTRSSPATLYRRIDSARVQQHQALDYAFAHDAAKADPHITGLLAWVGFDYHADMGNHFRGIKTAGLGDVFRILKPGAAIYQAQIDPRKRVVIAPAFTWEPLEFGQHSLYAGSPDVERWGPGERAVICSNCERLEVYLGDEHVATALPDHVTFPHLEYPPSFVDLRLEGRQGTDLRIEGYLADRLVGERRFSGDRQGDRFRLDPDDAALEADGVDATRVVISLVDRFNTPRGTSRARVALHLDGPATLIGDNPFDLESTGAAGAVWVRTEAGRPGRILLRAVVDGHTVATAEIESVSGSDVGRDGE